MTLAPSALLSCSSICGLYAATRSFALKPTKRINEVRITTSAPVAIRIFFFIGRQDDRGESGDSQGQRGGGECSIDWSAAVD